MSQKSWLINFVNLYNFPLCSHLFYAVMMGFFFCVALVSHNLFSSTKIKVISLPELKCFLFLVILLRATGVLIVTVLPGPLSFKCLSHLVLR